jgi:hypothetical protein
MTGVYEIRKGWAEETRVVGWDKMPSQGNQYRTCSSTHISRPPRLRMQRLKSQHLNQQDQSLTQQGPRKTNRNQGRHAKGLE